MTVQEQNRLEATIDALSERIAALEAKLATKPAKAEKAEK